MPDIAEAAFRRAVLARVEAAVGRDDHAAAVGHAVVGAKAQAKAHKGRGLEARLFDERPGGADLLPHPNVIFSPAHIVQRSKVYAHLVLIGNPGFQIVHEFRHAGPVFLVHIAADGDVDARGGHLTDRLHDTAVAAAVLVIALAGDIVPLRAVHGDLDVGKLPLPRHFLYDLRGDEASV